MLLSIIGCKWAVPIITRTIITPYRFISSARFEIRNTFFRYQTVISSTYNLQNDKRY